MKKCFLLILIPVLFFAQVNYKIQKDVISSGGIKMTAGNYVLHGTVSQTTIGSVTGGNYKGIIGFWQPWDWINPRAPYIVKVDKSGNDVVLTWNKVNLDVNGNPEIIQYYSVYRDTVPDYTPGTANFVGNSTGPDTTYTNSASLNAAKSYYYLVKAVDWGPNRSLSSNMGFKFNKFYNENPGATSDKNWVSLPWHNNWINADALANDLSATGDPLVIVTNMRNDQIYESYVWDIDFGWYGVNFNITSGRGYEMVAVKDSTLRLLGANNPNGLVSINENAGAASDKNWVSVPYNANYGVVDDIATSYSPAGIPLIVMTNMRNDQIYESYVWDIDFGWYGVNFAIERGRAYEFVTDRDTTWNPTEYSNEGGPVLAATRPKNKEISMVLGHSAEPNRAPVWLMQNQDYISCEADNPTRPIRRTYREAGISHIVTMHLDLTGYKDIAFTAYRLNEPADVLTGQVIGCGVARKKDLGMIWFNAGNFKKPWKDGEEVMLILEAVKEGRGYFATLRFNLDNSLDIQDPTRNLDNSIRFIQIPEPREKAGLTAAKEWDPVTADGLLGYSLYRSDERVNDAIIEGREYPIASPVNLRPVIEGGYETFYGSFVAENKPLIPSTPIQYSFAIFPNPFIKRTTVNYALPASKKIEIKVYDVSGRLVKTLAQGFVRAGYYHAVWPGQDDAGRSVSSGIYFIQMRTDDYDSQVKVIFVR